jgi:hypothetical protein
MVAGSERSTYRASRSIMIPELSGSTSHKLACSDAQSLSFPAASPSYPSFIVTLPSRAFSPLCRSLLLFYTLNPLPSSFSIFDPTFPTPFSSSST